MSLSAFSLVIGVFFYVFGFPLVTSDEKYMAWRKKFLKDQNWLRFLAVPFLVISVATLKVRAVLTQDAAGFVVAIAWAVMIKSVFTALLPALYIKLRGHWENYFFETQPVQVFSGFVMVLIGALFTYLGLAVL